MYIDFHIFIYVFIVSFIASFVLSQRFIGFIHRFIHRFIYGFLFIGLFIGSFVLPVPVAATDTWTHAVCIDNETLFLWEDISTSTGSYKANTTVSCFPHACDNLTKTCVKPYSPTEIQANVSVFLTVLLIVMSISFLIIGIKDKKYLLCMVATVFFIILSMQSVAFDTILRNTMFSGLTTVFIGIFWLFAIIGLIFTLVGVVDSIRSKKKGDSNFE